MERNISGQKLTILALDSTTGRPKTGDGDNLTAYVSIDDGSVTQLTNGGLTDATELDATNAPGLYSFDLEQEETDGAKLVFSGKSATGDVDLVSMLIYTSVSGFSEGRNYSENGGRIWYVAASSQVGVLTARTDDDTGTLTMGWPGHGISTSDTIDISWEGGSITGLTVGTVSGVSVPIDGGSGDALPAVGSTIVVIATTGNSDGADTNLGTYDSPLLTITEALSRAAPRDTIHPLPGAYNETVNVAGYNVPGITIEGANRSCTLIYESTASFNAVVTLDHGTTLRGLTVQDWGTGTGVSGIRKSDVTIDGCALRGHWDCLLNGGFGSENAYNLHIKDSILTSTGDILNIGGVINFLIENTTFNGLGTDLGPPYYAIIANDPTYSTQGTIRNCYVNYAATTGYASSTKKLTAISIDGPLSNVVIENTPIYASITEATSTGIVRGIASHAGTPRATHVTLINSPIITSTTGSGAAYDIDASTAGSDVRVARSNVDPAKLNGDANIHFFDDIQDSTLADTDILQQEWADAGRLDAILDARAAETSLPKTWYVASSGGDDGGLGTREDPLDTLNEARDRAVFGDTIVIMSGTLSLTARHDANKDGITYIGEGSTVTATSSQCILVAGDFCKFKNLNIISTHASGVGLYCSGSHWLEVIDCDCAGPFDAVLVYSSNHVRFINTLWDGNYDGGNIGSCKNFYAENSRFATDATSAGNRSRSLLISASDAWFKNCIFESTSTTTRALDLAAIASSSGSKITLDDCVQVISSTDGASTGDVFGVHVSSGSNGYDLVVRGGSIKLTNSTGSGAAAQVSATSGAIARLFGTICDPTTFVGDAESYAAGDAVPTDMTQIVPMSNTVQTVGDALNAARAQGFGRWVIDEGGGTITLYAGDGTTPVKVLNITPNFDAPTARTPV